MTRLSFVLAVVIGALAAVPAAATVLQIDLAGTVTTYVDVYTGDHYAQMPVITPISITASVPLTPYSALDAGYGLTIFSPVTKTISGSLQAMIGPDPVGNGLADDGTSYASAMDTGYDTNFGMQDAIVHADTEYRWEYAASLSFYRNGIGGPYLVMTPDDIVAYLSHPADVFISFSTSWKGTRYQDGNPIDYAGQSWTTGDLVITSLAVLSDAPEPATWAMMVGGFAIVGAALRRQTKIGYARHA